jgi:selenocysteine lyase/cysteine desulfurase
VSVSAVDFRTGYRADLPGIREAIGPDRLLVVDGIQAFGVADLEWTQADVLIAGAQKWVRAGWGVAAIAASPRAIERIDPLLTGWTGVTDSRRYDGEEHPPLPGAERFSISNLSPYATGAFAEALTLIESVGVPAIEGIVATHAQGLIEQLDAAGVQVLSPRERADSAGIVVAGIPGRAAEAHAALAEAAISTTLHGEDRIRFSVHATTRSEVFGEAATVLAPFA